MKISKQSVEYVDHMGDDWSVVDAARVSFAKQSEAEWTGEYDDSGYPVGNGSFILSDKDQKLINYLAKHGHWSPFAHTSISLRVKAPIFVARQMVKHQVGLSWNEVSRRYVDSEPEFYFPDVWRGKPENAKQGSSGMLDDNQPFFRTSTYTQSTVQITLDCYNELLKCGAAPEQARMVLPQNTMTEWIWTGSLMAFSRVCKQRLDAHAQQETQEVAKMIQDVVQPLYSHSWKALME